MLTLTDIENVFSISPVTNAHIRPRIIPDNYEENGAIKPVFITAYTIIQIVAKFYNTSYEKMCSGRRFQTLIMPMQVCMYLVRQHTNLTLTDIAKIFGRINHSTVHQAINRIHDLRHTEVAIRTDIKYLEELL